MYMSTKQAAQAWGISERRVRILCTEGRIDGVMRSGWAWNIPVDASKPRDGRQLRHLKNVDMRIGVMNYSSLEAKKEEYRSLTISQESLALTFKNAIFRFVQGAFSYENSTLDSEELALLYSGCFSPSLSFDTQILALNMRSLLIRMGEDHGLGPAYKSIGSHSYYTEQRLIQLYRSMVQGLIDDPELSYRKLIEPSQKADEQALGVPTAMEILMRQYEMEWKALHPIVRSLFLFGELLRIRPFALYNELFAALVMAGELLACGFPPAFVDVARVDEFKAALMLTRTRGNYQHAMRMLEQSMYHEISLYANKERG